MALSKRTSSEDTATEQELKKIQTMLQSAKQKMEAPSDKIRGTLVNMQRLQESFESRIMIPTAQGGGGNKLHYLAEKSSADFFHQLLVDQLVDSGEQKHLLSAQDDNGNTPLHVAAKLTVDTILSTLNIVYRAATEVFRITDPEEVYRHLILIHSSYTDYVQLYTFIQECIGEKINMTNVSGMSAAEICPVAEYCQQLEELPLRKNEIAKQITSSKEELAKVLKDTATLVKANKIAEHFEGFLLDVHNLRMQQLQKFQDKDIPEQKDREEMASILAPISAVSAKAKNHLKDDPIESVSIRDVLQAAKNGTLHPSRWFQSITHLHCVINNKEVPIRASTYYFQNFYIHDVTLQDIARLSKTHTDLAVQLLTFPLGKHLAFSPTLSPDFVNHCTFEEIKALSSPHFIADVIASFNYHGRTQALPQFILNGYKADVAKTWTQVPAALLQNVDFKTAKAASKCEKLSVFETTHQEIYDFALQLRKDAKDSDKLEAKQLNLLQQKVLSKTKSYPVPETEPWPNQDKLLACLEALEKIATSKADNTVRDLLAAMMLPAVVHNLIHTNVRYSTYRAYISPSLPLPIQDVMAEYEVTFLDTNNNPITFQWTTELKYYIQYYNMLPSKEFLAHFEKLLLACRTYFLTNAEALMIAAIPVRPAADGLQGVSMPAALLPITAPSDKSIPKKPRRLRTPPTAPAVITVTLSKAEEAQESMDNISTKINLVTTLMNRLYERLHQEIDRNNAYPGYKPWQNGGNERKAIDNLKEKFSQQVQQKFSALEKDPPEKKLELLPALLSEAKTIEDTLTQKESALEEAYSNCQRAGLREPRGQAKQKLNYNASTREEKKKINKKEKKETPQEKAERVAKWKAKQKKEAEDKKKMVLKTEIKTSIPVSVVSKQEKRDSTVRIAAMNAAVRQLRLLSLCLAHYAAEEPGTREPEYVRRDAYIRHFALQRYLLGCIHALKIYKNYGGLSSSQLEEKKLEDQRNMLIHADWVAVDEKTIYDSFDATLKTAEHYNKYLPEELLKVSHAVELKDVPSRAIVQLMRTFKVEVADTHEFDYTLVIEDTPLYKAGKDYDESSKSLTVQPGKADQAVYEVYLPWLRELMDMFNKKNILERDASWEKYFYFPFDAARMLLAICGELAPFCSDTDPELKPFVTRCREVRNRVAHSFTEKVTTSEILSLLDKRSLPERKVPLPSPSKDAEKKTGPAKTKETKTHQLRASAPTFTFNPPAPPAKVASPVPLAPAAPIMSIVPPPPPPIVPPFIPGLVVMSPYLMMNNPMLNFPVVPFAPPVGFNPPLPYNPLPLPPPPNMNQFFYANSNPMFPGATPLQQHPSQRRSGI